MRVLTDVDIVAFFNVFFGINPNTKAPTTLYSKDVGAVFSLWLSQYTKESLYYFVMFINTPVKGKLTALTTLNVINSDIKKVYKISQFPGFFLDKNQTLILPEKINNNFNFKITTISKLNDNIPSRGISIEKYWQKIQTNYDNETIILHKICCKFKKFLRNIVPAQFRFIDRKKKQLTAIPASYYLNTWYNLQENKSQSYDLFSPAITYIKPTNTIYAIPKNLSNYNIQLYYNESVFQYSKTKDKIRHYDKYGEKVRLPINLKLPENVVGTFLFTYKKIKKNILILLYKIITINDVFYENETYTLQHKMLLWLKQILEKYNTDITFYLPQKLNDISEIYDAYYLYCADRLKSAFSVSGIYFIDYKNNTYNFPFLRNKFLAVDFKNDTTCLIYDKVSLQLLNNDNFIVPLTYAKYKTSCLIIQLNDFLLLIGFNNCSFVVFGTIPLQIGEQFTINHKNCISTTIWLNVKNLSNDIIEELQLKHSIKTVIFTNTVYDEIKSKAFNYNILHTTYLLKVKAFGASILFNNFIEDGNLKIINDIVKLDCAKIPNLRKCLMI